MALLTTNSGIFNISAGAVVLNFKYVGTEPLAVIVRVNAGGNAGPLVGAGLYNINLFLNTQELVPENQISVPGGQTQAVFQSRQLIIEQNDTLSVTLAGQALDTAVFISTVVMDVTPVTTDEIVSMVVQQIANNADTILSDVAKNLTIAPERVVLGPCKQQPVAPFRFN